MTDSKELISELRKAQDAAGSIPQGTMDHETQWLPFANLYNATEALLDALEAAVPDAATEFLEAVNKIEAQKFDLRLERDAALAAIEVTRKLHHKITRYGNDYYSISAESYEDDPSSYDGLEPFDLCAECYEVERLICEECGGDAPIGHRSSWPCPTGAALDGAHEPEWEYGCAWDDGATSLPFADRLAAEKHLARFPNLNGRIVRRPKAPEWLPVEGESK